MCGLLMKNSDFKMCVDDALEHSDVLQESTFENVDFTAFSQVGTSGKFD